MRTGTMIQITERNGMITVYGHANYKPTGEDIVCAAISTLTQTFIESLTTNYQLTK